MSTYIPDLWIKHPENKEQIEKLVRKLYDIGETEIAAILGPGLLFEKGRG